MAYSIARRNAESRMFPFTSAVKLAALCALSLLLLLAACSRSTGPQSPDEVMDQGVKAIAADDYSGFLDLITPEARYDYVNDMFQLAVGPRLLRLMFDPNELTKRELREFLENSQLPKDFLEGADPRSIALPENANLQLVLTRAVFLTQHELLGASGSEAYVKMRETGLFYLVAASQIDITRIDDTHSEATVSFVPPGETQQKTITISIVEQDGEYYIQPPIAVWPWGRVGMDG